MFLGHGVKIATWGGYSKLQRSKALTGIRCVGVMQKGKVEILVNDQGNRITPSYVAFTDEERLVGDAAKNQAAANPFRTIFDIKRLIGRKFSEKEIQSDIKHFPFKYGNPIYCCRKRLLTERIGLLARMASRSSRSRLTALRRPSPPRRFPPWFSPRYVDASRVHFLGLLLTAP